MWSLSCREICQHNDLLPQKGTYKDIKDLLELLNLVGRQAVCRGCGGLLWSCQHFAPREGQWETDHCRIELRKGYVWCRSRREMSETRDVEATRCGASMTMDSCFQGLTNARRFTVCPAAGHPWLPPAAGCLWGWAEALALSKWGRR